MAYQVGKYRGNRLKPSFKIDRSDGGGVRIQDVVDLTSQESSLILAHFGRPFRAFVSLNGEQHRRLLEPGTKDHFEYAVRQLPTPFALMRKS